jgi:hypothetical protein
MIRVYQFLVLSVAFNIVASGQRKEGPLNYGLKAGVTRSVIKDLESTILSEPYFLNYTLSSEPVVGGSGGFFVNYRFIPNVALETQLLYSQQGSVLKFNNIEKDFNYKINFGYQYINVLGQIKFYPWGNAGNFYDRGYQAKQGFNLSVGPQLGVNISSQNIKYTSGGTGRLAAFGSDLEQQQQLRNVLKGKTNFGFSFGIGYEFENIGLVIDARYFVGLTDVVETQANSYNFIENKNTNKAIQFTLGWDFSFFNKEY